MRIKRARLLTAALLGVGIGAFLLPCCHVLDPDAMAVSVSYFGNRQFTKSGAVRTGPTFCLTNHTSKTLLVSLNCVEVQNRDAWIQCGSLDHFLTLSPRGSAYETIEFAYAMYPTNVWRVKGLALESHSGGASFVTAVRYAPLLLHERYIRGKTNIVWNPFGRWYGHHREIVSSTVLDPKSIRSRKQLSRRRS
jgi:hypothetical protein